MRIYTKCVINMTTMAVDEKRSRWHEYDGEVALCKGGGGGGATQGAPNFYYEQLVASGKAETKQARELFNFYKYGTFDAPEAQLAGHGANTWQWSDVKPLSEVWDLSNLNHYSRPTMWTQPAQSTAKTEVYQLPDGRLVVGEDQARAELEKWNASHTARWQTPDGKVFTDKQEAIDYMRQNRPASYADLQSAEIQANLDLIPQQTRVARQFYNEATNIDPDRWAQRAAATVSKQYADAATVLGQKIRRTGARVGGDRQAALESALAFDRAKALAAAKTTARDRAEAEKYNRLYQAVGGGM